MKILITAKINPDLDGVACAYAYAELLNLVDRKNEYITGIYGEPQSEVRFLLEKFNIKGGLIFNPVVEFDKFILVDASELKGMPEIIRANNVIEVIDHREINKAAEIFSKAKIQIELVGAAATLIFEKFQEQKIEIARNAAILLYGAIFSNTLNFQIGIASDRDKCVVRILEQKFGLSKNLIDEMFKHKTEYINNNLEEVVNSDFKNFDNGLGIAQLEGFDLEKTIKENLKEVKNILDKLKKQYALNYSFLTAADIKGGYSFFVVNDEETKLLLSKSIPLSFDANGMAKNNKLLLRKQILPLLINNL